MPRTARGARVKRPAPRRKDRRVNPERRAVPRAGSDRRLGPRAAARMARSRIEGDVEHLRRNVWKGNWRELARVVAGLAGELGSFLYAGAMFPTGMVGEDLPGEVGRTGAISKDLSDNNRPVILLHGWFHNRSGCALMARRLKAAGRRHVYALDLPTATASVPRMAEILDAKVARVCALTRAGRVDLVAHSLGGLVAHWWMHRGKHASALKNLVTLGAPQKGTALAAFVPVGVAKSINIGSEVVRALDIPPPRGVRVTQIWSDMDYLILPPQLPANAPGVVRVKYVGHLSLLYSQKVFREVQKAIHS